MAYQKNGELKFALEDIIKALDLKKNDPLYLNQKIKILSEMKNFTRSLEESKIFIASNPNNAEGYYLAGMAQFHLGQYEGCKNSLEKSVELDNNNGIAYAMLATVYEVYLNNKPKADTYKRKLFDLEDQNVSLKIIIADYLISLDDYDGAIKRIEDVLKNNPNNSSALNNIAIAYQKKKDFLKSKKYFDQLIYLEPNNVKYKFNRAMMFYESKEFPAANVDLISIIEKVPDFYLAYFFKGIINYKLVNYDAAIKDFEVVLSNLPDKKTEALYYKAMCFFNDGRYSKAINIFDDLEKLDPKNASMFYNRGIAKHSIGQHKEALADISKAIGIDGSNADYFLGRGIIRNYNEHFTDAINDFNAAIALNLNSAELFYHKGMAHRALKEDGVACTNWKKASDLGYKKAEEYLASYCN